MQSRRFMGGRALSGGSWRSHGGAAQCDASCSEASRIFTEDGQAPDQPTWPALGSVALAVRLRPDGYQPAAWVAIRSRRTQTTSATRKRRTRLIPYDAHQMQIASMTKTWRYVK